MGKSETAIVPHTQTRGEQTAQVALPTYNDFLSQQGPVKSLMPWGREMSGDGYPQEARGGRKRKMGDFKRKLG